MTPEQCLNLHAEIVHLLIRDLFLYGALLLITGVIYRL